MKSKFDLIYEQVMNMVSANTTQQLIKSWMRGKYTISVFLQYYDSPENGKYLFKIFENEQQIYNSNFEGIEILDEETAIKFAEQKVIELNQGETQNSEQYYDQRLDNEKNSQYI